ncbi:MAG: YifB family Mg chelatase-like AAA ATPase [Treponema sp.]|nr:YifB family Mg chelatase-like AAA ATPase [Treponema sp.]
MKIYSFSPFGYEGSLVSVEVDIKRGIPAIDMVGLADGAVKESRERMKSAIRNSGFDFPQERVLISLSPADLKKEGAGFDLAVALGVLCQSGQEGFETEDLALDSVMVLGELELSGALRPVRAVHAAAASARAAGVTHCVVPKSNANEAREVLGMKVFGAANLREAFEALFSERHFEEAAESAAFDSVPKGSVTIEGVTFPPVYEGCGFEELKGQKDLVRACAIAAAGGHNLLAFGPPGCGKSLVLQRFSSLLPLLTAEEAQSVTRIHSIAGLMSPGQGLVRIAPFRQPHMSASVEGMCGGGNNCRPGEISLAHNGVLFLDEAAEFRGSVLQMLRVPLESQKIALNRAGRTAIYPANFQLLMAANPCPCGNYGSDKKICLCSSRSIELYWKKFSAPLLDRIDLRVKVDVPDQDEVEAAASWSTQELRRPIARAVKAQRDRGIYRNSRLAPEEISRYCWLENDVQRLLTAAASRYDFSPRATASCKKIARTIADMEGSEKISLEHMAEAVDLRKLTGVLD